MASPADPRARARSYVSADADWVTLEATISTDVDQVALTSGALVREWRANGRRFFQYRLETPSLNFWAVQSARYVVREDSWRDMAGRDVAIQVFHHPTHAYNVTRMIDAVQQSLEYYSRHFSPYQHRQIRISEFPRYATFAQSLPDIIPYSESIGFIARVEDSTDIDYPFYVTAHEVAHQWWAHQVVGANAQGATMLSETLSQYAALMVMERHFGATNMRRFLRFELDAYLRGRSAEGRRELPLELVEHQPYIHYNKGALAMYALRDYLGEERVNGVLRAFLDEYRFRGPPYPVAPDLVGRFREAAPDSLRYVVDDLFRRITLYELKADSALVVDTTGGRFAVDLHVTAKKLYADSLGRETEASMRDWIDVAVYRARRSGEPSSDRLGVPMRLEKRGIVPGAQVIRLVVPDRPTRAGIDPLHKLIDRKIDDNTVGVQWRVRRP
jgi:aminopeptidase N